VVSNIVIPSLLLSVYVQPASPFSKSPFCRRFGSAVGVGVCVTVGEIYKVDVGEVVGVLVLVISNERFKA
jgi:hypothetical protein